MPITIDLEKNPLLKGMVEHVRKECTVENIMMVLHARFVRLPTALHERLQALSQGELDRIVVQAATYNCTSFKRSLAPFTRSRKYTFGSILTT